MWDLGDGGACRRCWPVTLLVLMVPICVVTIRAFDRIEQQLLVKEAEELRVALSSRAQRMIEIDQLAHDDAAAAAAPGGDLELF